VRSKFSPRAALVAQQLVDAGLGAGLGVDTLDDDGAIERRAALRVGQGARHHDRIGRDLAAEDLAGGAVLAMGVYLSGSTRIVDRATGEIFRGEVPAYSVVVPGALPDPNGGPSLYCAVIVKRVDAQTRAKTGVNELLRD